MITNSGIKKGSKLRGKNGIVTVSEVVECEDGCEEIVKIEGNSSIFIIGQCLSYARIDDDSMSDLGFKYDVGKENPSLILKNGIVVYERNFLRVFTIYAKGGVWTFARDYVHELQNAIEEFMKHK